MSSDLSSYRAGEREQARIADIFGLIPAHGRRALDIGARDGYLSLRLTERFDEVVALDLDEPTVRHPRIRTVQGNAAQLEFPDRAFDLVLCAEVLEHVPSPLLPRVCSEIARVAGGSAVIGVPYRQDLRLGRTTCGTCGKTNPPWGHVNSFDEPRLQALFPAMALERTSFVGTTAAHTNALSAALLDFAGNPYGTWGQEEPCVHCGKSIGRPAPRSLPQRLATRLAMEINRVQTALTRPHGNWIHGRFVRPAA